MLCHQWEKQHTEFWTDRNCLSQEGTPKVRGVLIILFFFSADPFTILHLLHPALCPRRLTSTDCITWIHFSYSSQLHLSNGKAQKEVRGQGIGYSGSLPASPWFWPCPHPSACGHSSLTALALTRDEFSVPPFAISFF